MWTIEEKAYEKNLRHQEILVLHDIEKEGVKISEKDLKTILKVCDRWKLFD